MLKVIGKIIGSNLVQDGVIPGVKVVKADGTITEARVGELLQEGDKIVSENPDVIVKVKYLALAHDSEYAGIFTVLTDNSVVAPAEVADSVLDGNVNDVAGEETAAGDIVLESSSPYISMDPDLDATTLVGIDSTALGGTTPANDLSPTSLQKSKTPAGAKNEIVDNAAPEFVSQAQVVYDENSTDPVIQVQATDTISEVRYSLAPGLDSALFTINAISGELSFISSPDYENPQDIGQDNIYNVNVIARDAYGNEAVQNLAVYINNLNDNTPITEDIAPESLEDALAYSGSLVGSDADGNEIEYIVTSQPAEGTLSVDPHTGDFTYEYGDAFQYLADGESATVTFTYKAVEVDTPEAYESTPDSTVTITIVGENDRPVVENVNIPTDNENADIVSYGETHIEYTETGIIGTGTVRLLQEGSVNYYDESEEGMEEAQDDAVTSIDQWSFTHNGGALTIDILTEATDGENPYSNDINGDGKIEMIDSQIKLFVKNPDGTFTLYDENDDSTDNNSNDGFEDGSQSDLDSYLSFDNLPAGEYMLAIGELEFSDSDALNGLNPHTEVYSETTQDGQSYVEGYGPYQVTINGNISNVEATTVEYSVSEIANTFVGLDTFEITTKETPPLGADGIGDENQIYGEVFTATSGLLEEASFEIKAASDSLKPTLRPRGPEGERVEEGGELQVMSLDNPNDAEPSSVIRFSLQKVVMTGNDEEGGLLYQVLETVYTSDMINLTNMDGNIVTLESLHIPLEEGQKYFFSVESISGAYQWEYADEQPADDLGMGMIVPDDAPSLEGGEEGTSSNTVTVWDEGDFSIRLVYDNGETVIFETNGMQTVYEGQLSVSDVDSSDTHTFQLLDDSINVTTESGAEVKYLDVTLNSETGNYSVSANFDALAEGEKAIITFDYIAIDDSGAANAVSEPATVTIEVTGTNDRPVVENVFVNGDGEGGLHVVDFENIPTDTPIYDEGNMTTTRIVNYENITWRDVTLAHIDSGTDVAGFDNGITSGENMAFNSHGRSPTTLTFNETATFHSVNLTAAYDSEMLLQFVAYKDGVEVYRSDDIRINADTPTHVELNWADIDTLVIENISGSIWVMDDFTYSVAGSDERLILETNGLETVYSGVLSVSDLDTTDIHTFHIVDETVNVETNSAAEVKDLSVVVNADGTYSVNGDFDELAAGEKATVTFDYYAVDDSGTTTSTSEIKTVTLEVTGTNDRPVVSDVTISSTLTGSGLIVNEGGHNSIDTALNIDSEFTLGENPDVANSETMPYVSISGVGSNATDWYAFTVTHAGDSAVFDIDYAKDVGGSFDSWLTLYDANGNKIVSNDDSSTSNGDGGSVHHYDSFLTYTFTNPGTYYIEVGKYSNGSNIPDGGTYTLQVSLEHPLFFEPIFETDGVETVYEDVLTVHDLDVTDTHTFELVSDSVNVVTESAAEVTDLSVVLNPNGSYSISGNFDALAEGEIATVTFDYRATDDSGTANAVSEAKTVTLEVVGTNDRPVIMRAEDNASLVEDDINAINEDVISYSATLSEAYPSENIWTIEHDGGKLQILMSSDEFDTFLKIYDSEGNLIATNDDSGAGYNSALLLSDLAAGTYTVEAAGALDEYGTYDIDFLNGVTSVTAPDNDSVAEVESEFGELSADGDIYFADIDTSDTHTISVTDTTTNLGTVVATETEAGIVTWEYTVVNDLVEYLAAGETREEKFEVSIDDGHGGVATQEVTVTITGTNDTPTINAAHSEVTGTVTEDIYNAEFTSDTTNAPNQEDSWTFNHTGGDLSVTMNSEIFDTYLLLYDASGNLIAENDDGGVESNAKLVVSDLEAGTYTVVASGYVDENASTESETVYQSGPYELIFEPAVNLTSDYPTAAVMTDGMTNLFTTGDVVFEEIDLSDTHTVSAAPTDSNNLGTLSAEIAEAASFGTGVVEWRYSVEDSAVQYLAEGETKEETFVITVTDEHGASVDQDITVTITGTNDRPIVGNIVENVSETDFTGSRDINIDGHPITVNNLTYTSPVALSNHVFDADVNDSQSFAMATYSSQLGLSSDVALGVTFTEKNPGILSLYAEAATDSDKFSSLKSEIISIFQNSTLLSAIIASSTTATELVDDLSNASSLGQVEAIINATPGFSIEASYISSNDGTTTTVELDSVSISAEATPYQYGILATHNVVNINVLQDTGDYTITTPLIDPLAGDEDVSITFAYNATDNSEANNATSASATVTVNVSGDNDAPIVTPLPHTNGVISMFDMDGGNVDLSSVVESSGLDKINTIVVGGRTELNVSVEDVLDVVDNNDHKLTITSSDDMADAVHLDDSFDLDNATDNGNGTHTYQGVLDVDGDNIADEVVYVTIEDTIYVD